MANPSAAHEPSMEEILASIRQIISEDGEGAGSAKAGAAAAEPPPPSSEQADEPATYESVVSRFDAEPEPAPMIEPEPVRKDVIRPQSFAMTPESPSEDYDEPPFQSRLAAPATRQAAVAEGPLLSPEQHEAVSNSFGALAQTMLAQNSRTLEDVVAEMLQPMLKSWLDDNLPSIVERMVKEEIERVSRGRR
jgi:cell pole-organizing protein PopZ